MTDTRRIHRDLGVLHDKAYAEAERLHCAMVAAGLGLFIAAAIVAAAILSDWSAIADRLGNVFAPPLV